MGDFRFRHVPLVTGSAVEAERLHQSRREAMGRTGAGRTGSERGLRAGRVWRLSGR